MSEATMEQEHDGAWRYAAIGALCAGLGAILPLMSVLFVTGPGSVPVGLLLIFGPGGLCTIAGLLLCIAARRMRREDQVETRQLSTIGLVLVSIAVFLGVITGGIALVAIAVAQGGS